MQYFEILQDQNISNRSSIPTYFLPGYIVDSGAIKCYYLRVYGLVMHVLPSHVSSSDFEVIILFLIITVHSMQTLQATFDDVYCICLSRYAQVCPGSPCESKLPRYIQVYADMSRYIQVQLDRDIQALVFCTFLTIIAPYSSRISIRTYTINHVVLDLVQIQNSWPLGGGIVYNVQLQTRLFQCNGYDSHCIRALVFGQGYFIV